MFCEVSSIFLWNVFSVLSNADGHEKCKSWSAVCFHSYIVKLNACLFGDRVKLHVRGHIYIKPSWTLAPDHTQKWNIYQYSTSVSSKLYVTFSTLFNTLCLTLWSRTLHMFTKWVQATVVHASPFVDSWLCALKIMSLPFLSNYSIKTYRHFQSQQPIYEKGVKQKNMTHSCILVEIYIFCSKTAPKILRWLWKGWMHCRGK